MNFFCSLDMQQHFPVLLCSWWGVRFPGQSSLQVGKPKNLVLQRLPNLCNGTLCIKFLPGVQTGPFPDSMSTLELGAEYCIVGSDLYHKIQVLLHLDLLFLLFLNHVALHKNGTAARGPKILMFSAFLCLLVCLCICTYHMCTNYITWIVAMHLCFS